MSAFAPRKLSGRRLSGVGSLDGCDRLDRLKMIQAIVELGLKPGRAAERLAAR
jgi:hypothetical protein